VKSLGKFSQKIVIQSFEAAAYLNSNLIGIKEFRHGEIRVKQRVTAAQREITIKLPYQCLVTFSLAAAM
jgi:hypothetical protein